MTTMKFDVLGSGVHLPTPATGQTTPSPTIAVASPGTALFLVLRVCTGVVTCAASMHDTGLEFDPRSDQIFV